MSLVLSLLATSLLWAGSELNQHLYPSDTRNIVVIDFAAIRASGLFAEQMSEDFEVFLQDNEHFRKLNDLVGENLAESTTMLTICGASDTMGPRSAYLSISNGDFSYDKISKILGEMAERGELSSFTINDLPVYFNHRSREAIYFTIVDDGVMIASSKKATIEDAIQGLTDLRSPNPELIERLKWSAEDTKEVETPPSVYLAGIFPEAARKQMEESPLREIAKDMVGYNLTIHLGEKALFRGRLELASEEAADRAEKTFNLFFGLMKTSVKNRGNRPDMLELLANAEIKAEKKDLHFDMTAPKTLLAQVSENDRKDPNSPRNRMRKMREERKEREARGEDPDAVSAEEDDFGGSPFGRRVRESSKANEEEKEGDEK